MSLIVKSGVGATIAASLMIASPAQARWLFDFAPIAVPETRGQPKQRNFGGKRGPIPGVQASKPEKVPPGPLHIVISLKQQRLTLYANGEPFAQSPVSTGVPGHPTPQGVFSVIQKNLHHRSNIYSSAPMPYMQRITWSGVALHEGKLPGYPASHGCIRLPREFAQRLWGITRLGARVIIAQDEVVPAMINHARLAALKPQETAPSASAEPAPARVRVATVASVVDAPLKGTIDPNDNTRIETLIDRAVQTGLAEADAFVVDAPDAPRVAEKGDALASAKDPVLRPGPISIYISRKNGKLYLRKGFEEVLEAPVTIAQPDQPLGTHLFSALKGDDASIRWNVVSLPTDRLIKKGQYLETLVRGEKLRKELVAPVHETVPPGDPNAALDRITIPQATLARIAELVTPGASLIISDLAPSHETGKGTDFIVLTR